MQEGAHSFRAPSLRMLRMSIISSLLHDIQAHHSQADLTRIRQAAEYAERHFAKALHPSGIPYLAHACEEARLLAQLRLDTDSIVTGLLHDLLLQERVTLQDLQQSFGAEVASLVEGVAKISRISLRGSGDQQAESFRKMLVALARDLRVILVKLVDRLHTMRMIERLPEAERLPLAEETRAIYVPLANRLGISSIKHELEGLTFSLLEPEQYQDLAAKVARRQKERRTYIREVQERLERILAEHRIEGEVTGRFKHLFSIYQKMVRQGIDFDQVYDLIAFRLIVTSVRDCYAVLGLIHEAWRPIPGRFKDYIAMPKANGYQSLHTTVLGPYGERMEIQIRTRDMHEVAEGGIAAHWQYKEGGGEGARRGAADRRFAWLRQLMEWQQDLQDSGDFLSAVKVDLFPDEVYVFTPNGDVKELPRDATPIDFAFAVHSDVGLRCSGARVNGRLVPLKTPLQNGDIIEILTSPHQKPSKDWLKHVRTSKARNKIRHFLQAEQRERSIELGREMLDKELRKHGSTFNRMTGGEPLLKAVADLGYKTEDDLLAGVGYGKVTPGQAVGRILPREAEPPKPGRIGKVIGKIRGKSSSAIRVQGVDDILVRFAKCCTPLPGDDIVGFITRGRGVTVHAADCPHLDDSEPDRRVDVSWDADKKSTRTVRIRVFCADRKGMLAAISGAITDCEANIVAANVVSTPDQRGQNTFEVQVESLEHFKRVVLAIQKVKGVERVDRLRH